MTDPTCATCRHWGACDSRMDAASAALFPAGGALRWCGRPTNEPPSIAPWRATYAHNGCGRHEAGEA